jgi:CYTH domain-containing protein
MTSDREIERKYLLRAVPPRATAAPVADIEQGYLPGKRLIERVRRIRAGCTTRYYRTVKVGAGVERVQIEEETTREVFDVLWSLTAGKRIRKRRYTVATERGTWEIDDFVGRALVLAEIELVAADAEVHVPDWLASVLEREVTEEPGFTNFELSS